MSITTISAEYFNSASVLKARVDELRELQKSKNFKEQKKIEDRIVILNAEYHYLLHTAGYLERYYKKLPRVSKLEVQYN